MTGKDKKQRKWPAWVKNTFEVVGSLTVVMVAYNLIGPFVYPQGRYFDWWIFPFSILLALVSVGIWSYHEEQQAKKAAAQKAKAARVAAEQLQKEREMQKQAADRADERRKKNAKKQQHK